MANNQRPAAQYLRMSTNHQQYSIDNQAAAIQEYAERNGFSVVQTYSDPGKTGLVLRQRNGLRRLLADVLGGKAPYNAILVYDVSRWGRFQDADESAHYEFLCKQAGIPVHYCAEIFPNDESLTSLIMKSLKRTMAAEYSRELSRKVYEGHKRLAQLGFKQGGAAGYGLRRLLVSPERTPKQYLKAGEHKSITTDRVILSPGPPEEIAVVREIYRMFVEERQSVRSIVRELNHRQIAWERNTPWKYGVVARILCHPKYCGCHVFGARTGKLRSRARFLPKSQWIMTPGAFEPVVDPETFGKAQEIRDGLAIKLRNEDFLQRLRNLLTEKGRLSYKIVDHAEGLPSVSAFRNRFGSLKEAYELIGYGRPEHLMSELDAHCRTIPVRSRLIEQIRTLFPGEISVTRRNRRMRTLIQLNDGLMVSVRTFHYRAAKGCGCPRWITTAAPGEAHLVTLAARLTRQNDRIKDLFLLPRLPKRQVSIALTETLLENSIELPSISGFFDAVSKIRGLGCDRSKTRPTG